MKKSNQTEQLVKKVGDDLDKPAPSPFGVLAGTVTIHDAASLTQSSGERWTAGADKP